METIDIDVGHEIADAPTACSILPRLEPQEQSRDDGLPWFDVTDEEFIREYGDSAGKESQGGQSPRKSRSEVDAQLEHERKLRNCANPFVRNSQTGETLLHVATRQLDGAGLIPRFLQAGVPVDVQDRKGWAPLHVAAKAGQEAICRVLLAHNARPNIRNVDGDAPLTIAVRAGQANVAKLLLTVPDGWSGEWDDQVFRSIVECAPSAATTYLDAFVGPELCTDNSHVASSEFRALAAIFGRPEVKASALTWIIASPSAPEIVKHRVIRHIIRAKQLAVGNWLGRDLLLYLALMFAFFVMVKHSGRAAEIMDADWTLRVFVVLFCVYFAWIEVQEFREICSTRRWQEYFKSPGNILDVITLTTTFVSCALTWYPHWNDVRTIVYALASMVLSLDCWKRLALGSILATMVGRMLKVALAFLFILYVPICCGFAGAFNVLLSGKPGFSGYGKSMVTTIHMLLGDVNWGVFDARETEGAVTWHQQFAHVVLLVYQLVTTIVLMNLLIAFMAATFDRLREDIEAKNLLGLAAALLQREAILSEPQRQKAYQMLTTKARLDGEIPLKDGIHSYPQLRNANESTDAKVAKLDDKVTEFQTQTQERMAALENKSAALDGTMKALDSNMATLSSQMTELQQQMQELIACLHRHPSTAC